MRLPMQGTRAQSLLLEHPHALGSLSLSATAPAACVPGVHACNGRSRHAETAQHHEERLLFAATESRVRLKRDNSAAKIKNK